MNFYKTHYPLDFIMEKSTMDSLYSADVINEFVKNNFESLSQDDFTFFHETRMFMPLLLAFSKNAMHSTFY